MKLRFNNTSRRCHAHEAPRGLIVAFTLLEVMIAVAIFFTCMFAVLGVMSQGLSAARALQHSGPTAGMVASEFSMTNKLEEGWEQDNFDDPYQDYTWGRQVTFYASNGLFQVDYAVTRDGQLDSTISFLLYRPDSPQAASAARKFKK